MLVAVVDSDVTVDDKMSEPGAQEHAVCTLNGVLSRKAFVVL